MVSGLTTKMSKFRARQLDATKPIPIYRQEDIQDYTDFHNATNRTVPQMPTGMEKEEEAEHHLQEAIFKQKIIPVPEVFDTTTAPNGLVLYDKMYPPSYKIPRQMIHIHPFSAEQDIPDYDLDSEDEVWIGEHAAKGELPLDFLQFEEMMDRLEKASGLKAVTLQEAKVLLKDDDDLITAVYDYWLNKRLRLQHPLIPHVKSEKGSGTASNDPYVAFRKRTEKMQTRKNRKNDESSYERMLKLKRDIVRAVTLLEMVKRREKSKRELLHLNIEVFEKRYEMGDYSGAVLSEVSALRTQRPAFAPLISNHQMQATSCTSGPSSPTSTPSTWLKVPSVSHQNKVSKKREDGKRERRPYKKWRRHGIHHISSSSSSTSNPSTTSQITPSYSHPPDPYTIASTYPTGRLGLSSTPNNISDDEAASALQSEPDEDSSQELFTFKRKKYVNYHAPKEGNWPWVAPSEGGAGDPRYRFSLTSVTPLSNNSPPTRRCLGFARRRLGRGGRVWIDRIDSPLDSIGLYSHLDRQNTPTDSLWVKKELSSINGVDISQNYIHEISTEWPHYCPSSPKGNTESDVEIDVETVGMPVTLSPVSLGATDDLRLSSPAPPSVLISAEVMEGDSRGAISDLEFSLNPGLDSLLHPNVLLDDNLQVDLPADGDSLPTGGKVSLNRSSSGDCNSGKSLPIINEMSESEWPSGSGSSSFNSNKFRNNISNEGRIPSQHNQIQHSTDFSTQPSSRFAILDYCNSSLPLTVSGLQLSSSSGIEPLHHQSSLSLSKQSSLSSSNSISSSSSFSSNSSLTCSSSNSTLINSSSTTSLSNSVSSRSPIQRKGTTSFDKLCINDNDTSNKLNSISSIYLHNQKEANEVHSFSITKNNGSNILSGGITNNLTSQKLLTTTRTNENLKSSENNSVSGAITNGPSNALPNSKCATKKDHYVFHES